MLKQKYIQEVLDNMGTEAISGHKLRDKLNAKRSWFTRWSGTAFYCLMDEMEADGYVKRKMGFIMDSDGQYSIPCVFFKRRV